ncbi:hypothetical protein RDABS01_016647 [Bienertia sinuspersici]
MAYDSSEDGDYSRDINDQSDYKSYSTSNVDDEEVNDIVLKLAALEKLNIGPKKNKLIIFNLNGLLIHRAHRLNQSAIPINRIPDGVYNRNRLVYKRDFLDEFMKFCLDRFEVGLWSSAQEYDQDRCTDTGFKSLEKSTKPLFLKELRKIWWHSSRGAMFSESNTLLVDDDPSKALLNPPNTGIFPETYDPNNDDDNALDLKEELAQYLQGLAKAEDVPSYVKEHSFGKPVIGPKHPNWDFYSRVIRRLRNN